MIVYGKQIFFYILEYHKDCINELYLAKECDKITFSKIAKSGFKIKKLDFKTAQAYAKGGNHQGFLLDIKESSFANLNEIKKNDFIVMLYGISDVGNIGAITRTAYALGVGALIFIGEKLAMEGVIRTSSGAALDLPIAISNDALSVINELKQVGFYFYASDGSGKEIHSVKISNGKKVLVLGSEGFGLSSKIIKKCDECVGIAMKNNFDSLNVVILFALFALEQKRLNFMIIGILGSATLIFLILSGGVDPILYQLKFYIFRSDESANLMQGFMYFNVNQTIQEVENVDLSEFMRRISGSEIVFLFSLFGFVWLLRKHKSMIMALPILVLGFLALKGGLRFTIYSVPVMALGFGFLLSEFKAILVKKYSQLTSNVCIVFATILTLAPVFIHIYNYKAPTVFSQNEASLLNQLKNIANREDYVVTWWDYGYPVRYYSDVKTLVDGGKHLGKDNFFPSFALSKDEQAAANMARLSVEYTEKSFYAPQNDILKSDILQAMMKDYNQSNVDLFLASLSKPDFKIDTPKTRDIYLYMPARMSLIFSTVASFSFINLDTGVLDKPFTFSTAYPLDVKNGEIYLSNGVVLSDDFRSFKIGDNVVSVNSIVEINSIKQGEYKITPIDDKAQFYIFYLKDSAIPYAQFILMDKTMFNSAYVQMFFLGNYDKNLFDLVINSRDAKVFKLKI